MTFEQLGLIKKRNRFHREDEKLGQRGGAWDQIVQIYVSSFLVIFSWKIGTWSEFYLKFKQIWSGYVSLKKGLTSPADQGFRNLFKIRLTLNLYLRKWVYCMSLFKIFPIFILGSMLFSFLSCFLGVTEFHVIYRTDATLPNLLPHWKSPPLIFSVSCATSNSLSPPDEGDS